MPTRQEARFEDAFGIGNAFGGGILCGERLRRANPALAREL
jgi:hypothetical protein